MIAGEVTPDKEAIIKLRVRGPGGMEEEVRTVLDTGFTEYLTLPPALIARLGLPYQYSLPLTLADGSPIRVPVYDATVLWNGQERSIPVQAIGSEILIGMSLLYGSRLLMDVVDGGLVSVAGIPESHSDTG